MFKDFDISKFKKMKPPGDNSITTKNEIKELKKIPIREKFINEMDDGEKLFTKIVGKDPLIGIELNDIKLKSMDSPAYPSGHATQATLLSLVLSDKYPEKENKLKKLARDIIHSRQVAHTHYKSDNLMGEKLGKQMYNHIKNKI